MMVRRLKAAPLLVVVVLLLCQSLATTAVTIDQTLISAGAS